MTSRKRSREELVQALHDQLAALRSSCAGYDSGNLWEGPRIATVVYTLVNDGRAKSKSILTQLGVRASMSFVSYSVPQIPGNLMAWLPLCWMMVGHEGARYAPLLGDVAQDRRAVKFQDWWTEAVYENVAGQKLSRMNLVFALRSKDGGSHFDEELPITPYLELKENGIGYTQRGENGQQVLIRNAHLATLRHIAFELEQSILPILPGGDQNGAQ